MLSIRGGLVSGLSWLLLGACGGTVVASGERQHGPNSGSGGATSGTFVPGGPGTAGTAVDPPIGRPVPVAAGGAVTVPPLTGGFTGTGARASTGGSFAAGGASPVPATCDGAAPRDPGGQDPADHYCCFTSHGPTGTCTVPLAIAEGTLMKKALGHDTCDPTLLCAPDLAALNPVHSGTVLEKCVSSTGAAGQCMPRCLVGGITQPMLQETCASPAFVCAPCYDPMDGTPTGVCSLVSGDQPPLPAPTPYRPCGAFDAGLAAGLCVPLSVVDASGIPLGRSLLQDDCPLATDRCVPTAKAKDPAACFQRCTTTLTGLGKQYAPGACVPAFVVRDTQPPALAILKREVCADPNALCAPCADPLSMPVAGVPTHYCE